MPTYVYKFVDTGETIEIQQPFHEDTLTEAVHPQTGETLPVKKVFQPVGVTFKGDGFYKTDSRASSKKSESTTKSSDSASSGSSDSGSTSTDAAKTSGSGSTTPAKSATTSSD